MWNGVLTDIRNRCSNKFFWIESNIRNFKSVLNKKKVIVQYTLPKWLSPSEVWMIYYRAFKPTNIYCMVYKWAYEGHISVRDSWKLFHMNFLKNLNKWVPGYELSFWNALVKMKKTYEYNSLWMRCYEINDTNDFVLKNWLTTFQDELLDYCIEKWWLKKEKKWGNFYSIVPILLILLLLSNPFFHLIVFIIIFIVGWMIIGLKRDELLCPWNIKLTEEWEKIFAEIYWYKYFLEHCEEEKIQELIKEDPDFIDKTLPYAIALRLNVDFLKYSISCFSIENFDIDVSALT